MNKIIAAGHICIDITPLFPSARTDVTPHELLEPGKLILMDGVDIHTGGSAANTGLALKILGNDVTLLGKIGADAFGNMIRDILKGYGVSGLLVDEQSRTSYSVVLSVPGIDRIFLHDPGANNTFVSSDIPDSALEDARLLHFGYPPVMKRMYDDDGRELVRLFRRAKEKGLVTSLDFCAIDPDSEAGHASWRTILQNVLPYVDFCLPSYEELCFMLHREYYDYLAEKGEDMTIGLDPETQALPLANQLIDMGCRAALIKCGTSGMVCRTASETALIKAGLPLNTGEWADQTIIQPCFRADVVRSSTGAGDTSIAAFLTAVLEGRSPSECTALAAAQGACCVTGYDALSGIKPLAQLEARMKSGWETIS